MIKVHRKIKFLFAAILVLSVLISLTGCNGGTESKPSGAATPQASTKKMPDQLTKIKVAMSSQNINLLPWYVADQKGFFKKYNLDVEFQRVDGDVIALRGVQAGDYAFMSTLPESVITAISEGGNVKLIGTLTDQSMYSIFVTPDIQKLGDLKGKAVAGLQPGSGVDNILRYLLKQNGVDPEKDARFLGAGGNSSRMQALKTGQAHVTLLSPPTDQAGEEAGLKKLGLVRDILKSYDHDTIATNGKILKDTPEIARAFMAATADGTDFIKNPANRAEVIQIGTKVLSINEQKFVKSLEFAIPSYGDKGKLNLEGIQWAINTSKETGALRKDLKVEEVVDERYYAQ